MALTSCVLSRNFYCKEFFVPIKTTLLLSFVSLREQPEFPFVWWPSFLGIIDTPGCK